MIKVLMISMDAKILEEGSSVRERMIEYGNLFAELHIVVFSTNTTAPSVIQISTNVYAYPTRSISKLLYVTDGVRIGERILKEKNFLKNESVITTQDPFETGIAGRLLSKKTGIPLHVQIHTDFQSPYFKKSALNKIRIALSKIVLPHARAIRVVSDRIKDTLPAEVKARVAVLPIFADVSAIHGAVLSIDLKKKYPAFEKVVLIASRLTKEKDIKTAFDAFALVLKTYPKTGLVIIGEGPEKTSLHHRVLQYGLEKVVVFEPWMDRAAVISCMKSCNVFLSSSLYEGYGLSMLEAHAAGAVLVATDAGIAPLLVSGEALSEPGDVVGMARALSKALAGEIVNKPYQYPYTSKQAYLDVYRNDVERALTLLK